MLFLPYTHAHTLTHKQAKYIFKAYHVSNMTLVSGGTERTGVDYSIGSHSEVWAGHKVLVL